MVSMYESIASMRASLTPASRASMTHLLKLLIKGFHLRIIMALELDFIEELSTRVAVRSMN